MSKKVDAKRNLDEIRADIDNDPEISEEERVVLRSVLQQVETPITGLAKLTDALRQQKKPSILRRLFRRIIR